MADYRLTTGAVVVRTADGAFVPNDPDNKDRQAYDAWLAAGNEPEPSVPPPISSTMDGVTFLARVADGEYQAIAAAAAQNAQIARWIEMLRLRGDIDVNGATAQAAKAGLVAAGLLTQERADAIFAPPS
jgi:hypothetical protein